MSTVLAVDLGTGGPKVGIVAVTGELVASEHLAVPTALLPNGGAEQDAAVWWQLVCDAARRLLAAHPAEARRVVAVSCTGQWASTVPVDDSGVPVGPCLLWLDTRGEPHSRAAFGGPVAGYKPTVVARWVRRTGGAPSTSGADPIGHILYFEHERPEVARAARWYLEPVDYLSMRFSGVAAASHASMAGAWLTDNRRTDHLAYDPTLLSVSGVPGTKLPPLVPTCSVLGEVLPEVAAAIGLPGGVKVVAGTPDLHSAAAGSGALAEYQAHLVVSTTSWISCPVPAKKTDAVRQMASVPGVSPGRYLVANNHETAGRCLDWAREVLFGGAGAAPLPSFEALLDLAATAPPGSGGAIFTPWLAGERSPVDDRRARGGFHNLSLRSSRAGLVRAVLEGVAYNDRWLHEAMERFTGRRLDPVRMVGGGARSPLWCRIHADVLGRTVEQVADPWLANLRGAALLAGLALGYVAEDEVRELVPVAATYAPEPAAAAEYDRLFAEFPTHYRAQKQMFARLNER